MATAPSSRIISDCKAENRFRSEPYWTEEDDLSDEHKKLVEEVADIALTVVRRNADRYDAAAEFPAEDIEALWRAGFLTAALPERFGGRDYGIGGRDALALYLIIETLARVSPATAHCFQINAHTCRLLADYADEAQMERYLAPLQERGAVFVGAGAEPGGGRQGTVAVNVPGGFRVTGQKHYATNATHADWLMVVVRDPALEDSRMLMIHRDNPGLRIDSSVWKPVGMRACVSPMLYLDDCFVPDADVLGPPGAFFDDLWLAKINMGFTANYLGTLYGMYDWLVPYLRERSTRTNTVFQASLGEIKARIGAARLAFRHAVQVVQKDVHRGLLLSNEAKFLAVDALNVMIHLGNQAAGSTALFTDYPYERLMRDAHVHLLHRRQHVGLQIVGQAELREPYNLNLS